MGATQTVSVLFTDLVGSTGLSAELGPARWDPLLHRHLTDLDETVAQTGGTRVKSVGDGLMVVYRSAAEALTSAVAMQQAVERGNRLGDHPLGMRVGIAAGDTEEVEGDWYGRAAIEAKRLCDLAVGDQILVSATVAMLAVSAHGVTLEPVGPLALKGFADPVETWAVIWQPLSDEQTGSPLPAPLRELAGDHFVGRDSEREALAAAWGRARAGTRSIALVSGQPGIGKTTLAVQLAIEARRQEAIVLYGRSEHEVGLPYEPWRQAFAHLLECVGDDLLERHVDRHDAALLSLTPALATRVDGLAPSQGSDAETDRYLLFAAAVALLEEAARERPVLLVLDDLHWAGRPTIALLKHLQLSAPQMPLLVLVTHRDAERDAGHPLDELLETLRRQSQIERLSLTGLNAAAVETLIESAAVEPVARQGGAVARELHEWTEGNPFFVTETIRHLDETAGRWTAGDGLDALELPVSVIEVIRGRVARLGSEAAHLLRCAAVIGRDFDVELLSCVAGGSGDDGALSVDTALDVLDEAAKAALVTEHPDRDGRYTFVHALVARALEHQLTGARRARLHERIAEQLEARISGDPGSTVGDVARHWAAARGPRARAKALEFRTRAGHVALAQLAPDEALEWFAEALDGVPADDERARLEPLLGLGEAQVQAGVPAFRETLLEAARVSLELGDDDRLVRAALLNNRGMFSSSGRLDEQRLRVLESALERAREEDPRRARLLALVAAELLWSGDDARRRSLSDAAVAHARSHGDSSALAYALMMAVTAVWSPSNLAERLEITEQSVGLSDGSSDPVVRFWSLVWRATTLVQAGRLDDADRELAALSELAERVGHPRLRFVATAQEAWRASLAGRIADAERLARLALTRAHDAGEPDAEILFAAQLLAIRWHEGRLADVLSSPEVLELAGQIAEPIERISEFRAFAALSAYEAGEREGAAAMLTAEVECDFADIPADPVTLGALTLWGELAGRLRDERAAELLLPRLEELEDQIVVEALGTLGLAGRVAGSLAATLGRSASSDAHFERALHGHERIGAGSLAARTEIEWGVALAADGRDEQARARLTRGAQSAADLSLAGLERRARAALDELNAEV